MLILATALSGQVRFLCFMNVNLACKENFKGQTVFLIVLADDPGPVSLMKTFLISQYVN